MFVSCIKCVNHLIEKKHVSNTDIYGIQLTHNIEKKQNILTELLWVETKSMWHMLNKIK